MTDLDTLRPEVREAVREIEGLELQYEFQDEWETIRAELLRQAREIADLRDAIVGLGAMRKAVEAELAALKARIDGGVDMGCPVECFVCSRRGRIINPFTPPGWIGKRVRLVVDE